MAQGWTWGITGGHSPEGTCAWLEGEPGAPAAVLLPPRLGDALGFAEIILSPPWVSHAALGGFPVLAPQATGSLPVPLCLAASGPPSVSMLCQSQAKPAWRPESVWLDFPGSGLPEPAVGQHSLTVPGRQVITAHCSSGMTATCVGHMPLTPYPTPQVRGPALSTPQPLQTPPVWPQCAPVQRLRLHYVRGWPDRHQRPCGDQQQGRLRPAAAQGAAAERGLLRGHHQAH